MHTKQRQTQHPHKQWVIHKTIPFDWFIRTLDYVYKIIFIRLLSFSLALLYVMFYCVFVTFPCNVLGQVYQFLFFAFLLTFLSFFHIRFIFKVYIILKQTNRYLYRFSITNNFDALFQFNSLPAIPGHSPRLNYNKAEDKATHLRTHHSGSVESQTSKLSFPNTPIVGVCNCSTFVVRYFVSILVLQSS